MAKLWVDVETTGLDKYGCAIVEIAAIPVIDDEEMPVFHSLVKPHGGAKIDQGAFNVHKISQKEIDSAPDSETVLNSFIKELSKYERPFTLSGHNVGFDVGFIYSWFCRYGKHTDYVCLFRPDYCCTFEKAKERSIKEKAGSLKLGKLCNYFGIQMKKEHRAFDDIKATIILNDMIDSIPKPLSQIELELSQLSGMERRKKLLDSRYLMLNTEGSVYISEQATSSKEIMRVILTELWEIFGEV